ncbi:MAG: rhodanese-like domain-containing protein [Alphaproteobacteria bacterium]
MPQKITKGYKALVVEAEALIETIDVADAIAMHGQDGVVFVDLRDIRELARTGRVPGATHAPRGMLEFWIDPESPYHREVFAQDKRFVLFCAAGWRSALATRAVQEMGLTPVCHIRGGFTAWEEAGGPVDKPPERQENS